MKTKQLLLFILLINITLMQAQNEIEQALDEYADGSIEYISTDELAKLISSDQNIQLLDTRSKEEFEVSSIENALFVGYEDFELERYEDQLDKNLPIILYCSIGVRSEKIGEQLKAAGFNNIKNLRGGIFKWFNEKSKVVNQQGEITDKIHGFNEKWSRFLKRGEVVY
jgi:rhodanese-related sulfurtransferase